MKKTILTLGSSVVALSPIVAVVACGTPSTDSSSSDYKFETFITSSKGINVLNNMWMEKVLSEIATHSDDYNLLSKKTGTNEVKLEAWRKDITKYFLLENVRKNPQYLISLSNKIASIDDSQKTLLNEVGFNKQYTSKKYEDETNGIFKIANATNWTKIFGILNAVGTANHKYKKLGFAYEINKLIMQKAYLSINKDEWKKTFDEKNKTGKDDDKVHTQTLSTLEESIDDGENFVLNKTALSNRLAFKWSMSLTKPEDIVSFTQASKKLYDSSEAVTELTHTTTATGTIEAKANSWKETHSTFHKELSVFDGTKGFGGNELPSWEAMSGFKGLTSLPSGRGQLEQTDSALKDSTKTTGKDFGFIYDGALLNTGIKLYDDKAADVLKTPVSLTAIVAIIPRMENGKLKLNATNSTVQFDLEKLSTLLLMNSNHYQDAIKYFSNKSKKPIRVEIKDEYIKNKLKDLGIGFIK